MAEQEAVHVQNVYNKHLCLYNQGSGYVYKLKWICTLRYLLTTALAVFYLQTTPLVAFCDLSEWHETFPVAPLELILFSRSTVGSCYSVLTVGSCYSVLHDGGLLLVRVTLSCMVGYCWFVLLCPA